MGIRILHTADLHLSKEKPSTLRALDEILKVAQKNKIDILTIGGDLFDKGVDAEDLRVILRKKFSKKDFKIIAIPGNHDVNVYREGLDFGENFIPILDEPFDSYASKNLNLVAVPYTEELSQEMLVELKNAVKSNKINLLLLHCTLDIGFSTDDFGNEKKYCPITKSELAKLNYDYILAGHFHKKTNIISLNEKSEFIYPGSPTSITRKELGKRKAVLIDLETRKTTEIKIKSFYFDKLEVTVYASKEDETITLIKKWLDKQIIYDDNIEVIINGFINKNETKFRKSINDLNGNVSFTHDYKDVSNVLNDPLFVKFKEKLDRTDNKNKKEIEKTVIEVFSKVLVQGS